MRPADSGTRPWPEQTDPALADTIARLRRAMRRAARVADPGNSLAVAQLELLACLADNPGVRPGQLARLLHLRPNSVTTLVNGLVTAGMINRVAVADDRRAVALGLTDEGVLAVHAWQSTNSGVLRLAMASLTPAHRRALLRATPALDALTHAVDRLADASS
jgi:DNA-binding MarR family transcriptional regulator